MPVLVTIQYPEGKGQQTVERVAAEVTDVLSKTLKEPAENIRIDIREMPLNRYLYGGEMAYEKK